jgi:hypothetical protein
MEQEAAYLRFGVKALMSSLSRIHETIDLAGVMYRYGTRARVSLRSSCSGVRIQVDEEFQRRFNVSET